jgi:hypothetical protein
MVRTGSGAIPLEGALVTVRGGNAIEGDALASFITDRSGNTPRIALPAPSKRYSESPGDGVPYGIYNVEVSIPGYYANIYSNIPVFDTITSVQTADMIPLPESGSDLQYGGKEVILFDARTGERLRGKENES